MARVPSRRRTADVALLAHRAVNALRHPGDCGARVEPREATGCGARFEAREPRAAELRLRTSRRARCDKLILPVHYSVNHAARRRRMPGVRDGLPEKDTRRKEELGTKIEVSHEKCLYPGDCPGSEESLRRESPGREYLQFGRTFQSLLSPWDTSAFVPESAVKRVLFRSAYRLAASQSAATAHRCEVCGWRGRSTSAAPSRAR